MIISAVNVSEGRDPLVINRIARAAGRDLLDIHSDPHHHRSVLTVVVGDGLRSMVSAAVDSIDLRRHRGVHPRLGAVDVVPFVAWGDSSEADADDAAEDFTRWAVTELGLPVFRYGGNGPTLPELRRSAFTELAPAAGPDRPHPTAGATAVGRRGLLVAYNIWLSVRDVAEARRVAAAVRGDDIRALGLTVGGRAQVSMNLIDPLRTGPMAAHDRVAAMVPVEGAELVGLVPAACLEVIPPHRWPELDVGWSRTIEAALARRRSRRGLTGGVDG